MRHENRERVHCHGTDLEVFQANERLHERVYLLAVATVPDCNGVISFKSRRFSSNRRF